MKTLVLTLCLLADPDRCQTKERVIVEPMQCFALIMQTSIAVPTMFPGWRLDRIECTDGRRA